MPKPAPTTRWLMSNLNKTANVVRKSRNSAWLHPSLRAEAMEIQMRQIKILLSLLIAVPLLISCSTKIVSTEESSPGRVCNYKFSDSEIVEKFKSALESYYGRAVNIFDGGELNITKKNCSYYVTYFPRPYYVGSSAGIIFDAAGEVVEVMPPGM